MKRMRSHQSIYRRQPLKDVFALLIVVFMSHARPIEASGEETREPARHAFAVERNVIYSVAGDTKLKADIYVPTEQRQRSRPGVLMIHGGAWMSGNKLNVAIHAMKLARKGYVVMAIDYRLAPKHKFPAQLDDCESALRWFAENATKYNVDTKRMATYGYSAGGHLACLLGLKSVQKPIAIESERRLKAEPNGVKLSAVVAGGAPCEFRLVPKKSRSLAYWLGGTREEVPDQYRSASPTAFVSRDAPPVFFFHGNQDRLVPLHSPEALRSQLQKQKTTVKMKIVKNCGHVGAFFDGDAMAAAGEFLDSQLKPIAQPGASAVKDVSGLRLSK